MNYLKRITFIFPLLLLISCGGSEDNSIIADSENTQTIIEEIQPIKAIDTDSGFKPAYNENDVPDKIIIEVDDSDTGKRTDNEENLVLGDTVCDRDDGC